MCVRALDGTDRGWPQLAGILPFAVLYVAACRVCSHRLAFCRLSFCTLLLQQPPVLPLPRYPLFRRPQPVPSLCRSQPDGTPLHLGERLRVGEFAREWVGVGSAELTFSPSSLVISTSRCGPSDPTPNPSPKRRGGERLRDVRNWWVDARCSPRGLCVTLRIASTFRMGFSRFFLSVVVASKRLMVGCGLEM